MKKIILGLAITIVITGCFFNHQIINWFHPQQIENKEISLKIGSGNNYSAKAYESSYASVTVILTKVDGKKETVLWKKTFDTLPLSQYPSFRNAAANKIVIPGTNEKNEQLLLTYIITYNTRGNILQTVYGEPVSTNNGKKSLSITI